MGFLERKRRIKKNKSPRLSIVGRLIQKDQLVEALLQNIKLHEENKELKKIILDDRRNRNTT